MASVKSGGTKKTMGSLSSVGGGNSGLNHGGPSRGILLLRQTILSIYGTFQIMSKKGSGHSSTGAYSGIKTVLAFTLKFLQILAFALTAHAHYEWVESTVAPIRYVAEVSTGVPGWSYWLPASAFVAFYYLALVWVFVFVSLFIWATVCFMRQSWPVLWPLKVLSAMGSLSATTLYIPFFYLLMSNFTCQDHEDNPFWFALGYDCYQGGHVAQTIVSAVLVVLFVILCSLFSLVYYESNPLSVQLSAKAHGRMDFIFLVMKTVLVLLVEVYPHMVGSAVCTAAVVICGVVWVTSHTIFMPFLHHKMNQLQLGFAMTFLWAGICLALAEGYPHFDAAVMLYAGAPFAFISGSTIATWRALRIHRCPVDGLWSPYEVELKVRYYLHEQMWGHPFDPICLRAEDANATGQDVESAGGSSGSRKDGNGNAAAGGSSASGDVSARGGNQPKLTADELDSMDDSEAQVLLARRVIPLYVLDRAEEMFRDGTRKFRHSSILQVLAARFFSVYVNNHHLEMSHLMRAERRHPPVDVSYLIFQARKANEDGTGAKGGMSALNRVSFEKYLADARQCMMSALNRQMAFWNELLDPVPDITKLHDLCTAMNQRMAQADHAFQELLHLNAQSLVVLRLYADFCMYVVNDGAKAAMLIAEAERIEDQQAKDHQREAGQSAQFLDQVTLDVMADNTGVITIGASYHNLGIISDCNVFACKLFGYSRWQLERRNISMLMPSPFSELHDGFLRHYLETGIGRVVDYTRVVVGLHRNGHIFPMLLAVRETPPTDGEPGFVGIVRSLSTNEHHIILNENFHVTAASQTSCSILDVEPASLTSGEARIQDWVVEWHGVLNALKEAKGTTICFDANHAHRVGQSRIGAAANADDDEEEIRSARGNRQNQAYLAAAEAAITAHRVLNQEAATATATAAAAAGSVAAANGMNTPNALPTEGSDVPPTASPDDGRTWARAHLQTLHLPGGATAYMLHWTRLSTDKFTIAKAQTRRRESLTAMLNSISRPQLVELLSNQGLLSGNGDDVGATAYGAGVGIGAASTGIAPLSGVHVGAANATASRSATPSTTLLGLAGMVPAASSQRLVPAASMQAMGGAVSASNAAAAHTPLGVSLASPLASSFRNPLAAAASNVDRPSVRASQPIAPTASRTPNAVKTPPVPAGIFSDEYGNAVPTTDEDLPSDLEDTAVLPQRPSTSNQSGSRSHGDRGPQSQRKSVDTRLAPYAEQSQGRRSKESREGPNSTAAGTTNKPFADEATQDVRSRRSAKLQPDTDSGRSANPILVASSDDVTVVNNSVSPSNSAGLFGSSGSLSIGVKRVVVAALPTNDDHDADTMLPGTPTVTVAEDRTSKASGAYSMQGSEPRDSGARFNERGDSLDHDDASVGPAVDPDEADNDEHPLFTHSSTHDLHSDVPVRASSDHDLSAANDAIRRRGRGSGTSAGTGTGVGTGVGAGAANGAGAMVAPDSGTAGSGRQQIRITVAGGNMDNANDIEAARRRAVPGTPMRSALKAPNRRRKSRDPGNGDGSTPLPARDITDAATPKGSTDGSQQLSNRTPLATVGAVAAVREKRVIVRSPLTASTNAIPVPVHHEVEVVDADDSQEYASADNYAGNSFASTTKTGTAGGRGDAARKRYEVDGARRNVPVTTTTAVRGASTGNSTRGLGYAIVAPSSPAPARDSVDHMNSDSPHLYANDSDALMASEGPVESSHAPRASEASGVGGGGVGGGAGSYASSRRSLGRKAQDRLRKALSGSHTRLLPSLRLLKTVGILITIIAVALGAVVAAVVYTSFTTYKTYLANASLSNQVLQASLDVAEQAGFLMLTSMGWLVRSQTEIADTISQLDSSTTFFSTYHRQLYDSAASVGQTALYTTPNVGVATFLSNGQALVSNVKNMSLLETGVTLVASAQAVQRLPFANITSANADVQLVLTNGAYGTGMYNAMNRSAWEWYDMCNIQNDNVGYISMVVFVVMSVIIGVLTLFVVLPILVYIDRTRDAFVLPVVQLPTIIPAKLRARVERRLKQLQQSEEEDEEDDGDNDTNDDLSEGSGDDLMMGGQGGGGNASVGGGDYDWGALISASQNTNRARQQRHGASMIGSRNQIDNRSGLSLASSVNNGGTPAASTRPSEIVISTANGNSGMTPADAGVAGGAGGARGRRRSASGGGTAQASNRSSAVARYAAAAMAGKGAKTARGGYRKSYRSLGMLALHFLAPLLVVFIFFAVIYSQADQTLSYVEAVNEVAIACDDRVALTRIVPVVLRRAVRTTGTRAQVDAALELAREAMAVINYRHMILTIGGYAPDKLPHTLRSTIGNSPYISTQNNALIAEAMFNDACPFIASVTGKNISTCESAHQGVLKYGLHAAFTAVITASNNLLDRRDAAYVPATATDGIGTRLVNGVNITYSIGDEIASNDYMDSLALTQTYLVPAFQAISRMYYDAAFSRVTQLQQFVIAFVASFLGAFIAYQALIYLPSILQTNRSIKEQRVIFLLLPAGVVQAVPELGDMIFDIVTAEEAAARAV